MDRDTDPPPDLYMCDANDLDKYIFDHLQPSERFQVQVRAAVKIISDFLKENCYRGHPSGIKVEEVVKGGSSAKGTALRTGSDADLVVFLNCIKSYDDQNKKRKAIIEEIREKLDEFQEQKQLEVIFKKTKWDNPRVLSFELLSRSNKVEEFIDFDVLPAYDAFGERNSVSKSKPQVYADLIKNWSEGDNFSTCFTKLQVEFISTPNNPKLKSLIRLVKHWYKTKLSGKKKLPPKYALELLCIYAWEKAGGGERFNTARAFRNVLALICNYKNLCVYWTKNYNFEDNIDVANFLEGQLAKPRPVILDPADPTGNVAKNCNWEQVAQEAEHCLSKMYIRDAADKLLLFKEYAPSPLISQNPERLVFVEQVLRQTVYSDECQSQAMQEESSIWSYCTIL